MARPDFGTHIEEYQGIKLACRYVAPGLTFHDLARIFHEAKEQAGPNDHLAGNPALWPDNRGIDAVVHAVLKAIYGD